MLRVAGSCLRRAFLAQQPATLLAFEQQACSSVRCIARSSSVQGGPDSHQGYEHTPTVFDRLVTINVVDLDGKRRSVRGVVGQTLSQVLVEAGYPRVRPGRGTRRGLSPSFLSEGFEDTERLAHCSPCLAVLLLPQHGLLHAAHRK